MLSPRLRKTCALFFVHFSNIEFGNTPKLGDALTLFFRPPNQFWDLSALRFCLRDVDNLVMFFLQIPGTGLPYLFVNHLSVLCLLFYFVKKRVIFLVNKCNSNQSPVGTRSGGFVQNGAHHLCTSGPNAGFPGDGRKGEKVLFLTYIVVRKNNGSVPPTESCVYLM